MALKLLDNISTDTVGDFLGSEGFQGSMRIFGDLDGGTITIEIAGKDDSDPINVINQDGVNIGTFIVTGFLSQFSIPIGVRVRATLSGSTTPVGVSVIMN